MNYPLSSVSATCEPQRSCGTRIIGELTIADVAELLANLNDKIHLLRKGIAELKKFQTISVGENYGDCCSGPVSPPYVEERNSRSNLQSEEKLWERESDDARSNSSRFCVPGATDRRRNRVTSSSTSYNDAPSSFGTQSGNDHSYFVGVRNAGGSEAKNVLPVNNSGHTILGNGGSSKRGAINTRAGDQRRRKSTKSTITETEKSDKSSSPECYGKRVRKRISRGVQTTTGKKQFSHRVKRRIIKLLKFTWRSRRAETRKRRTTEISDIPPEDKSIRVIYKSRGNTEVKDDNPSGKEGDETDSPRLNTRNRKYDLSVDGKNIEIVRREQLNTETKDSRVSRRKSGTPLNSSKRPEKRRQRGRVTTPGGVNKVGKDVDKSGRMIIKERKKPRTPRSGRSIGSDGKDNNLTAASTTGEKIEKQEKPVADVIGEQSTAKVGTKIPKVTKNFPPSKWFTKSGAAKKSTVTDRQKKIKGNAYPDQKTIRKQPNVRTNDIADVKRRLDACIEDLNGIILNLSKTYQAGLANGGPAGEGIATVNENLQRRGRSRDRQ
ncbi:protein SON-like [Athalia rosae]|uniref:protein SON-like n=1 Tax=Athalia rosae TaxID=37344 RepID=UPI00203345F5|nr:protein SON-like [Athalia rosae]